MARDDDPTMFALDWHPTSLFSISVARIITVLLFPRMDDQQSQRTPSALLKVLPCLDPLPPSPIKI